MLEKKLKAIVIGFLITGCATTTEVPVTVKVTLLPFPVLPTMTSDQEKSIPDDIYEILSKREETLIQHIVLQSDIIKLHNDF